MNIPTLAAASESVIHDKEPIKSSIQFGSIPNNIFGNNVAMTKGTPAVKKVSDINAQWNESSEHDIAIKGNSYVIINSLGEHCDANKSPIKFGSFSNFMGHRNKKDEIIIVTKMKNPVEIMPKSRGRLCFKGERMMS